MYEPNKMKVSRQLRQLEHEFAYANSGFDKPLKTCYGDKDWFSLNGYHRYSDPTVNLFYSVLSYLNYNIFL